MASTSSIRSPQGIRIISTLAHLTVEPATQLPRGHDLHPRAVFGFPLWIVVPSRRATSLSLYQIEMGSRL